MNKLTAVFLAGALTASASDFPRVSFIPTTMEEVTNYVRTEINRISIGLGVPSGVNPYWEFGSNSGVDFRWSNWAVRRGTNTLNLELATSNGVFRNLTYAITNSVGYGLPIQEGQDYYIIADWQAWYDNCGRNVYDNLGHGSNPGSHVRPYSSLFRFTRVGGQFVIPPEAFQLTADWIRNNTVIPAVASHPRWVDYAVCNPLGSSWIEQTRNGTSEGCSGWTKTNGFIFLRPQFIQSALILPRNFPEAYSTFTIWYDEDRTDGTEWKWDASGVHKREILPPKLSIVPVLGGNLRITLTGGVPERYYFLETVPPGDEFMDATTDTNGVATWIVVPNGSLSFFRARLY